MRQRSFVQRRLSPRLALIGAALALTLAGCTTRYRNHGYTPTDAQLAQIAVGVDTRESVAETVGTPTSAGVLNGSGYYYVSSRFRLYGALEPQEVEREVLAITFDPAGRVENIERFGLEDGAVVPLSRRVTSDNVRDTPKHAVIIDLPAHQI